MRTNVISHPYSYRDDYFLACPVNTGYGMLACPVHTGLPNRHEAGNEYRYGFQGQEKDDEIAGEGNIYTAEFWQYDSRLGKRWNIDPVVKEHESPYATFANNPIWFMDPNGADSVKVNNEWMWRIQDGDTYIGIGEKTGVNPEDLENWNGYDAKSLQKGYLMHLSECGPNPSDPFPDIPTPYGTIKVGAYHAAYTDWKDQNALMSGVTFTPYPGNSNDEFMWFQTVTYTKDGKTVKQNDNIAGMRASVSFAGLLRGVYSYNRNPGFPTWNPNSGELGHLDAPSRNPSINTEWRAVLVLYHYDSVSSQWEKVQTLYWGFNQTDGVMTPVYFSVNPLFPTKDIQTHDDFFQESLQNGPPQVVPDP